MTFLYPDFLWALSAISIPIIIHLFNFRIYKTLYFSNVRLLQNIEEQTRSYSKLKNLLILLLRILAISSIVIAFAQPVKIISNSFLPKKNCRKIAAIYIDNSFSMNAETSEGKAIEVAKAKATSITKAFTEDYRFLFLNNDMEPKQQYLYYPDIIRSFISATSPSPKSIKLSKIVEKQLQLLKEYAPECNYNIFLISDFQKITADIENLPRDTNINYFFIPIKCLTTSNIYIDSVWFFTPYRIYMHQDSIGVRVVNTGEKSAENIPITLYINDTVKAVQEISIPAKKYRDFILKFSNIEKGKFCAKISISDYPIIYDNTKYFCFQIGKSIPILLIENEHSDKFLQKFYSDSNYFHLTISDIYHFPYTNIDKYNAVILNRIPKLTETVLETIKKYVLKGGILIYLPSFNTQIDEYNKFLNYFGFNPVIRIDSFDVYIKKVNKKNIIYRNAIKRIPANAKMPRIKKYLKFSTNIPVSQQELLQSENGDNLLISKMLGKGKVYVFAFNLSKNSSDFALNPLMTPTFYNIAIFHKENNKIYYTLGKEKIISLPPVSDVEMLKMAPIDSDVYFIPEIITNEENLKIKITNLPIKPGCYKIKKDKKEIALLAFNYDTKESKMEFYDVSQLKKLIKRYKIPHAVILTSTPKYIASEVKNTANGIPLWKYFIILGLIFLAMEIVIVRVLK